MSTTDDNTAELEAAESAIAITVEAEGKAALARVTNALKAPLDQSFNRGTPRQPSLPPTVWDVRDPVTLVSQTLSPMQITADDDYDDTSAPAVATAVAALQSASDYVTKTIAAREGLRADPTLTQSAQVLEMDAIQMRLMTTATKALDAACATLRRSISDGEAALRVPLAQTTTPIAVEVRSHMRSLSTSDRMALIQQSVAEGDVATVSAVLGAGVPAYLSGLAPEMVKVLTESYNMKRNPVAAKRLSLMRKAMSKLEDAGSHIIGNIEKVAGVHSATVAKIRAQHAKARAVIGANAGA